MNAMALIDRASIDFCSRLNPFNPALFTVRTVSDVIKTNAS